MSVFETYVLLKLLNKIVIFMNDVLHFSKHLDEYLSFFKLEIIFTKNRILNNEYPTRNRRSF